MSDRVGGEASEILVNDYPLLRGGGGIRTYLANVLSHWPSKTSPPCRFSQLHPRLLAAGQGRERPGPPLQLRPLPEVLPRRSRRGGLMGSTPARRIYAAWLARALRRGGYGLYFEPNNVPLAFGPRTVVTLHDLSVHEHPQWHTPGRVGQWRRRLAQSLERTDHWITPSAFTRDRLIRLLDVRPECISVIPLAGRSLPDPSQSPAQGLADAVPQSCFLHVGTIEPRKNLPALLDAWLCTGADFRRRNRLVLAGGCGWGPRHLWRRLAEHPVSSEVLACGYVSEAQLAYLLAHARALVLPSTYEGFGLPIVEAARFATPVICSTAPVFAEVAGDAAERIDPANSEAWAQAMRRMAEDAAWREQCGRRISRVSEAYNWRVTAEAHAALFRRLLTRPG